MIEITLPWPDKVLNPNKRAHWRVKYEAKKIAREVGCLLTMEAKVSTVEWYSSGLPYRIVAQYTFYPPDRRHRDQDNYSAMMKSYQDGVCDVLGIDDSCFQMAAPVWGEVVKGGKVVLRLEELSND